MTSTTSKIFCMICNKNIGQFKCEGCSQTFCIKHVLEHRQTLNQQLDEILLEHDQLKKTTNENNNQHKSLINYIDQWEQKSIEKIRQIAKETRHKVKKLDSIRKQQTVSQELENLTQQIKVAQQDDDFFETDIQQWKLILEKFRNQLKNYFESNEIIENKNIPLIYQIQMISSPSKLISLEVNNKNETNYYQMELDTDVSYERFDRCYGNAKIEQNGRLVINGSDSFFGTEIRGKIEYSSGRHEIRLRIENNPSKIWIFIGIVSKETPMGENLFTSSSVYGWGDYNDYFIGGHRQQISSDVLCIHTCEKDIIELIIDCINKTIRYTNERSGKSQELDIDTDKCPFPWQLYLSLGGKEDQISLVNTIATF